jgi:hypothetical protein
MSPRATTPHPTVPRRSKPRSADLNDGETKVPAYFAKSLASKFGAVKTNAVLKLTDVSYKENGAFVNAFEFVQDIHEEYTVGEDDVRASKRIATDID